jgi:hypothetical protein
MGEEISTEIRIDMSPKQCLGVKRCRHADKHRPAVFRLPSEPAPFNIGVAKQHRDAYFMAEPKVIMMAEDTAPMTWAECRAFVERTRRQLDRFDALPHEPGQVFPPEYAAEIRSLCNELEQSMKRHLG